MQDLLKGMKVLDLTRVLAGPYASMVLADLGAEVLKIELPEKGDESRGFGPFQNGESAYFTSVNRGKKSVTVDLRTAAGCALAKRLVRECDVLLENFRPGSMARFGLDYESLQRENPRLVYASISGFGQTGPYAQRPAYDVIIQAMGGDLQYYGRAGRCARARRVVDRRSEFCALWRYRHFSRLVACQGDGAGAAGRYFDARLSGRALGKCRRPLLRQRRSATAAGFAAPDYNAFSVFCGGGWLYRNCRGQRRALAQAVYGVGTRRVG